MTGRSCAILFALLFGGCLISEVDQYTLLIDKNGKTGTLTVVRRNLQSDSEDSSQQRNDFQELIENRTSDKYLLTQLDQGFYVKERSLTMEKGTLVWKEKLLVSDISKVIPEYAKGSPIRMAIHDTSGVSIRTNGHFLLHNDSLVIEWPANTQRLELTSVKRQFATTSRFTARYQAYRKRSR
jgi:hypothetical protein